MKKLNKEVNPMLGKQHVDDLEKFVESVKIKGVFKGEATFNILRLNTDLVEPEHTVRYCDLINELEKYMGHTIAGSV